MRRLEVVARGVVEGEAGHPPELRVEVLEPLAPELRLAREDLRLRARQDAADAAQHGERQDDVLAAAAPERFAAQIRDAPRKLIISLWFKVSSSRRLRAVPVRPFQPQFQ